MEYGRAAVLIAIGGPAGRSFPEDPAALSSALHPQGAGSYRIPLIRRPASMRHHAGQISLPGGECGAGETTLDCALREASEEIGLSPSEVEVLGNLTDVFVPVSRYRIQPVVGWVRHLPPWQPQVSEVEEILVADPDRLLAEGPRGRLQRERDGIAMTVPAFVVPDSSGAEALVWGATAMILGEFLQIWRKVRS
jgi:8-oxo-dGTP pyrophosphatase MutT (NUDIX family)